MPRLSETGKCGARDNGQKMIQRHIWAEHLDLAEELRKTSYGKFLYALRKESIERVFADAKEKHGMRYTNHRGLARVTQWVTLKFACMNLKKLASRRGDSPAFSAIFTFFFHFQQAASEPPAAPVVLTVKCGISGSFYNFSYCMRFMHCDILTMEKNQIGNRKRGGKTK